MPLLCYLFLSKTTLSRLRKTADDRSCAAARGVSEADRLKTIDKFVKVAKVAVRFLNQNDKQAFLEWIAVHPDGYCTELRRGGLTPLLHRVGCCCLGVKEIDWTPIPVHCFDDKRDIKAWFYENDDIGLSDEYVLQLEECEICEP
jgi:hypothetical protein